MSDSFQGKSIRAMRDMSNDDLIAAHDSIATLARWAESPESYRAELARRETDEQTKTVVRLTWAIAALTVVNTAFVIYSAVH